MNYTFKGQTKSIRLDLREVIYVWPVKDLITLYVYCVIVAIRRVKFIARPGIIAVYVIPAILLVCFFASLVIRVKTVIHARLVAKLHATQVAKPLVNHVILVNPAILVKHYARLFAKQVARVGVKLCAKIFAKTANRQKHPQDHLIFHGQHRRYQGNHLAWQQRNGMRLQLELIRF